MHSTHKMVEDNFLQYQGCLFAMKKKYKGYKN